MAEELSSPSWFDRVFSAKGVLSFFCFMVGVFSLTMIVRRSLNISSSVSVTVYEDSGVLFKGFPGGSTSFIHIAPNDSVKPSLDSLEHMSNEKEFFHSKAKYDASFGDRVDAFRPFQETIKKRQPGQRIQSGFWTKTLVDGNPDLVSWHPMWNSVKYMEPPQLLGSDSNTRFTLIRMPSHNGPVSLSTSDLFS
eukprot:1007095_1